VVPNCYRTVRQIHQEGQLRKDFDFDLGIGEEGRHIADSGVAPRTDSVVGRHTKHCCIGADNFGLEGQRRIDFAAGIGEQVLRIDSDLERARHIDSGPVQRYCTAAGNYSAEELGPHGCLKAHNLMPAVVAAVGADLHHLNFSIPFPSVAA